MSAKESITKFTDFSVLKYYMSPILIGWYNSIWNYEG